MNSKTDTEQERLLTERDALIIAHLQRGDRLEPEQREAISHLIRDNSDTLARLSALQDAVEEWLDEAVENHRPSWEIEKYREALAASRPSLDAEGERCPTCGSDDPSHVLLQKGVWTPAEFRGVRACDDAFHDTPSTQQEGVASE